jgi:hypothetical protein
MRRRYSDDGKNHHIITASILEACGRGLLIATAGLVLGAMLGTSNLAAVGLWTLGVAAAVGVGLHIGAGIVHNIGCGGREAEPEESRQTAEVHSMAKLPSVLAAESGTPAERRAGYVVLLDQEREQQHGHRR